MQVSEIMAKKFLFLDAGDNLLHAAKLLSGKGRREAPVLKGSKFIGMFSMADLAAVLVKTGLFTKPVPVNVRTLSREPLSKHIKSSYLFLGPDSDILSAFLLVVQKNVDCVPVLDKKKNLVGVVLAADLEEQMIKLLTSSAPVQMRPEQKEEEQPGGTKTTIDSVLSFVLKQGSATSDEIARHFSLPISEVEEYTSVLEKNGFIKVDYSLLGKITLKRPE